MRSLLAVRPDVYGTTSRKPAWRLDDVRDEHVRDGRPTHRLEPGRPARPRRAPDGLQLRCLRGLLVRDRQPAHLSHQFPVHHPLAAPPGGSFRSPPTSTPAVLRSTATTRPVLANAIPPPPTATTPCPRSPAANLIYYYGKRKGFPCANLRLYSVFGPLEDSSRLIPNLIRHGLDGRYPEFVNPTISRDFVYVDDVTEAFVDTALNLAANDYGESFNIGTGSKTTIGEVAATARRLFDIAAEPVFTMPEAPVGRPGLVRQHRQGPGAPELEASHHLRARP